MHRTRMTPTKWIETPRQCVLLVVAYVGLLWTGASDNCFAQAMNLKDAVVVVADGDRPPAEAMAAQVLVEEVQKRTSIRFPVSTTWPEDQPVIAIGTSTATALAGRRIPRRRGENLPEHQPEGYRITVQHNRIVWILGADPRGALFGVGHLLRSLRLTPDSVQLPLPLEVATSPAYPIRGHQLGYRSRANTYDAWDAATYEQYIRELVLFGTNCIENIPFEDARPSPHMPVPRNEMNLILSQICARYDLDYWVWTPAVFDLNDRAKRAAALEQHQALYAACPRLDAVFFPGGDPGNNPPHLVMPFLADLGKLLMARHPNARVWISLQGFDKEQTDFFFSYVNEHMPDWLGGLVAGPSSPPIAESRKRLPKQYKLRHYPDITHTVRCQYPVSWWDPAYNFTLGRECPNPQPVYYALIHNWFAPHTDGFLTYSEGIHDDVNKIIWSMRGWNPEADVRDILEDYARFFFGPDIAGLAADGILALEQNWEGPLAENGAVEATLALWQNLEARAPELHDNWRWQLCLLRSAYDAYTRRRLLYEMKLEEEANLALAQAPSIGSATAIDRAKTILDRAITEPISPELRGRIEELAQDLFETIGLQTSVEKYQASGGERGAILDYVDSPLNNRWWLEDEFDKIRTMPTEAEKLARIELIRTWENPGPGSFYDDVGNVAKSPHVVRGEGLNTDPEMERNPNVGFWWWYNGFSRQRLSWQTSMDWPIAVTYENLDTSATYVVRLTGYGEALTRMNGERVLPTLYGKGIGEFKEFPVPEKVVKTGKLVVTWDRPDESHLNWRQQSRLTEIWLLKQ